MTAAAIDQMQAGRELDALVAEQVMGWPVLGWTTCAYADGEWTMHPGDEPSGFMVHAEHAPVYLRTCHCADVDVEDLELVEEDRIFGHYTFCLDVVPRFSTEIAAAWQVVEKMRSLGWFYSVSDVIEINEHLARFFKPDQPDAQAMDASVSLAICRAALKACNAEQSKA